MPPPPLFFFFLKKKKKKKGGGGGIGIWDWASNDQGAEPDVVMTSAGDIPTLEALAAVDLLRQHFPDLRIRWLHSM